MFWFFIGLLVGLFAGFCIGYFTFALMAMAKEE